MTRIVAVYARVSTEHEAQLSALENQVQYYDDILASHPDWKLYKRYIDEGVTGTSIKKRKNFLQMLEDAKNGCFDLIVTREVSRFARNTVDTLIETRNLKKYGVEVYFTEDNIWTFNDEDGELKLTIMATLAQNESKKISQRVKAGQEISFKNGVIYGNGNILGYDKVSKEFLVNEEQGITVQLMYSLLFKGYGTRQIKYELEARGRLTATGKKTWHESTIVRVLQNTFYCGIIVYRKSYIPNYLEQKAVKNRGEVQQIIVEGKHQPLISKEDFLKAQKILQEHSTVKDGKKLGHGAAKNLWSKKLVCTCSNSFNRTVYHKDKKGNNKTYCYQCYNQKNNGSLNARKKRGLCIEGACDIPLVQEWKLYLIANVIFDSIWKDKDKIIVIANKLIEDTLKDNIYLEEIDLDIKTNMKKIDGLNKKSEKLLELYLNELIKKDEYILKKKEIESSIEVFKKKNIELELQKGYSKETVESKVKSIKESLYVMLKKDYNTISDELIDSLVEKIIVTKEGFKWKLAFLCDIINVCVKGRKNSSQVNLYANDANLPTEQRSCTSCNKKKTKIEIV